MNLKVKKKNLKQKEKRREVLGYKDDTGKTSVTEILMVVAFHLKHLTYFSLLKRNVKKIKKKKKKISTNSTGYTITEDIYALVSKTR